MAVNRQPHSVRTGFTPHIFTEAGVVAAPVGWEYTGVAVPRGTTLSPELQTLSDALQAQHDAVVSAVMATAPPLQPVGGGNVIQLGSSNSFVSGDFTGGLPGSSGGQGSVLVDLISKGLDVAQAFAGRSKAPTAPMVMNQLPGIGPAIIGGAAGAVGSKIIEKGGELVDYLTLRSSGRRRRRMNVLNPRALRRSMRRVQGFAKFASKTISFTKRVRMKKRRR